MGTFKCYCGYVIHDTVCPCPSVGDLMWEPELESQSSEAYRLVTDYLQAVSAGRKVEWLAENFPGLYPSEPLDTDVIYNIYSDVWLGAATHGVYQCPECQRLYVQKKAFENDWECYEKAK